VFTGRITVCYADHEEVIEAGEAFYMPPDQCLRSMQGASS